ncbi:hypothetical protein SAMN02745165_01012 [Malonomonas rubra DSM 5091]|uniref:Hybrid cluster protein-associated redox disulfide domain-containing protein n=1 Tax=Malonomonas rubra DSM 5091 TaxID=1122189 RepID=A0A1M6EB70_MALRU|nr:DUF1858 domain-containing protein [Malonomonas rubra]SHI82746.1 hypothetical protein SAMN02745165_01012 [Malonomonas rubra DSM 5091]
MTQTQITRTTKIEKLIEIKEDAVAFLFEHNIRCIRCGEPIWDTIEEAARKKDYNEAEIDALIVALNELP